jgi:hypothetical protein
MDLDMTLLRFTSVFSFLYMIFTIITGAFNNNVVDFPNELNIVSGSVAILQIWDRFYEISLRPKTLPIKFSSSNFGPVSTQKQHVINLHVYYMPTRFLNSKAFESYVM